MPLIVLSYLVMPLGLSVITLPLAEWGTQWVLATAHWVAAMDGAVWNVPIWDHSIFILMVISLWLLFIWKGKGKLISLPLFLILTLFAWGHQQPDIQISDTGDLISIRDQKNGQLYFSTFRTDRYSGENWLRQNGQLPADKQHWTEYAPVQCDAIACRLEINHYRISISNSPLSLREECAWADILIANSPVPRSCKVRHVIDRFDIYYRGAHAIWLNTDKPAIKNTRYSVGNRPWALDKRAKAIIKKNFIFFHNTAMRHREEDLAEHHHFEQHAEQNQLRQTAEGRIE